jgi:hypothetical protein
LLGVADGVGDCGDVGGAVFGDGGDAPSGEDRSRQEQRDLAPFVHGQRVSVSLYLRHTIFLKRVVLQQSCEIAGLRDGEFEHDFHGDTVGANADVRRIILRKEALQVQAFIEDGLAVALLLLEFLLKFFGLLSLAHV